MDKTDLNENAHIHFNQVWFITSRFQEAERNIRFKQVQTGTEITDTQSLLTNKNLSICSNHRGCSMLITSEPRVCRQLLVLGHVDHYAGLDLLGRAVLPKVVDELSVGVHEIYDDRVVDLEKK
jgi:hypothetical protein